jgi:hypothetical protein
MNQLLLLYGLRLLSAVILLVFLAVLAWFIYADLRIAAGGNEQNRPAGRLRVIESIPEQLAAGTLFPLLPVTSIGRAMDNTIVIDDGFLSNHHVLITMREQQWWLEDRGSRNGTLLNDFPLTDAAVISHGDVFVVGRTQMKFELDLRE